MRRLAYLGIALLTAGVFACSRPPAPGAPSGAPPAGPAPGAPAPSAPGAPAPATPAPTTVTDLRAVHFVNPQTGWAAGAGAILATRDGGRTWDRQYEGAVDVTALSFPDPDHGWALSAESLLATGDGGQHWEGVEPPPGRPLRAGALVVQESGWVVAGTELFVTEDGGRHWQARPQPLPLEAACFTNMQYGWAVSGRSVLRTADGGIAWRRAFVAPLADARWQPALGCGATVWAMWAGDAMMSQQAYAVFAAAESGEGWTPMLAEGYFSAMYPTVDARSGIDAYAGPFVSHAGFASFLGECPACPDNPVSLTRTTDSGRTWEHYRLPGLASGRALSYLDAEPDRGWVAGRDGQQGVILATADGGQHWRRVYPTYQETPVPAAERDREAPPAPPASAAAPVLTAESGGYRLEVPTGGLGAAWLGPALLLARWWQPAPQTTSNYLVDLAAASVRLLGTGDRREFPGPGGQRAALTGDSRGGLQDLTVTVVAAGAEAQPVFPGWAAPPERHWPFGEEDATAQVTWLQEDVFLLTLVPVGQQRNMGNWGKVLLVDLAAQGAHTLAERGQVAAVLPDGGLLLRRGWVDGALEFLAPPYTGEPVVVAPGGPWTAGWAVSEGGRRVAWLESATPPGDWSARLPHGCCSGDPAPQVRALAIWDRDAGSVRRFALPATGIPWRQGLLWTWDGQGVLFSGNPTDTEWTVDLYKMSEHGEPVRLARYAKASAIELHGAGPEGSLYYSVGNAGTTDFRLVRRYSDGREAVLRQGMVDGWGVESDGRWLVREEFATVLSDPTTGRVVRAPLPGAIFSSDATWAIAGSFPDGGRLTIRRTAVGTSPAGTQPPPLPELVRTVYSAAGRFPMHLAAVVRDAVTVRWCLASPDGPSLCRIGLPAAQTGPDTWEADWPQAPPGPVRLSIWAQVLPGTLPADGLLPMGGGQWRVLGTSVVQAGQP